MGRRAAPPWLRGRPPPPAPRSRLGAGRSPAPRAPWARRPRRAPPAGLPRRRRPCAPSVWPFAACSGPDVRGTTAKHHLRSPAMSARTRDLPRRSCLSVPGSSEKMLAKGPTLAPTWCSSTWRTPSRRSRRRRPGGKVVDAIRDQDWGDKILCVRINAWDTEVDGRRHPEVVGGAGERLEEIMLPKVQTAAEVVALDLLLTQVEQNAGLPLGPHRHRGPDRDGQRPHQRRGDLRRVAPRSRRSSSVPSTCRRRWRCRRLGGGIEIPELSRRLLPLRVRQDPHGGPGQRPAGHRRALREGPRPRGLPRLLPALDGARLRRQVGAAPRPDHDPQRAVLARPRSSSTRRSTSSTPTRRRPPPATARAP